MNKELLDVLKELGFGHDENDGIDLEGRNNDYYGSINCKHIKHN